MGDLRNKFAKLERAEAHRRFLAEHFPTKPPPPPIRCFGCGKTHHEVPEMLAIQLEDFWRTTEYWCTGCLPISMHGYWYRPPESSP